jgi:hypothetical protein
LTWKLGRGDRIIIGKYLWMGSIGNYMLSTYLENVLINKVIKSLVEVVDLETTSIWNQGWKSKEYLGIQGELAEELKQYL